MFRPAAVFAVVVLAALPGRAPAQSLRVVDAKIEKGNVTWTETKTVQVARQVQMLVNINGMAVPQTQTVVVNEQHRVSPEIPLKGLTATDASGKVIPADALAVLLKEETPVVLVTGTIPKEHRALFKDKTVFVEVPSK